MSNKKFQVTKVEKLPNSEAQVTGEISLPFLVELRPKAVKYLSEHAKISGFRPGKIPEDVLVKNLGEMRIVEETAELALAQEFNNILKEAKLTSIGRPEVSITKIAVGAPLEFRLKVYLEPEFSLPDYKKIAKEIKKSDLKDSKKPGFQVSDKEVANLIKELAERNIKADLKEGEKLEDKIKENLLKEKEHKALEKRRLKILEELVKETKIELPKILIDSELEKMLAQFRGDVEQALRQNSRQAGNTWSDYLKQTGKTEEEIKNEWRDKAEERVKAELIFFKIAEAEKIEPTKEEVEHEAEHLLHHYPDAEPVRVRLYIYNALRNQKVIEFLSE